MEKATRHDCCLCSKHKKERSPEEYTKLIHRLNRIEGQIRGIRGMVENGAYCPDILIQQQVPLLMLLIKSCWLITSVPALLTIFGMVRTKL